MNHDRNIPVPRPDGAAGPVSGTVHAAVPAAAAPGVPADIHALQEEATRFNPLQLVVYLVRYRLLIAVVLLLGLLAGFLVTMMMPPQYRAEAMIEIMPPSVNIMKDLRMVNESSDIRTLRTALTKLKSRELMRRVVHELGLATNDDFLNPKQAFSLSALRQRILGRLGLAEGKKTEPDPQARVARAVAILRDGLSVRLLRNTRIISISYSSTDPDFAWRIPNQVAASYISFRVDQASESTQLARQFLAERVEEVKRKLALAEKRLVAYAKEAGITLGDGEKEDSLIASNIRALNEALSEAIRERLKYERLVRQIEAGKTMQLPDVVGSEAIQAYRRKIVELRAQYRQKLRLFKPDYPEMRELKAQIDELTRLLREDVRAIAGSIRLKYNVAVQRERDLRRKLKELEEEHVRFRDKNIRYTILKREVDSLRAQYQGLVEKLNRLDVASEVKNKAAAIVQYAERPLQPYAPRLGYNLLVALLVSAGLAAGLIYILEQLHSTFTNPDQLEGDLRLPVLGVIPRVPEERLGEALSDPRSPLAEAFYTLRTSLQFTGVDSAPRSLLVTSSEASEGKSTVVRKLAESFASLGLTVLVIDADMRRPTQHRHAGIPNTIGLSNLLTNTVPAEQAADAETQVMRNTPWKNVWMITAGTLPPNPPNLLASQKMGMLVEATTRRFDIVIIDAPPVLGFADALLLSRLTEATLLVVAARKASRKSVQGVLKRLQAAGGHVVGTVFNRFEVDSLEYRYTYRYSHYGYYRADGYLSYGDGGDNAHGNGDGKAGKDAKGRSLARLWLHRRRDGGQRSVEPDAEAAPPPPGPGTEPPEQGGGDKPAA